MVERIGTKVFNGGAPLGDDVFVRAFRDMAIADCKAKVAAAVTATTLANLTDSSGGAAANGTLNVIPVPAAGFTEAATASAQKAGLETALGLVKNGITELAAKVVALKAFVPASDLANNVGGTAADGTIAAYTVSLTAVNTSIASFSTGLPVLKNIRNYFYTLAIEVNKLAVAVGVAPITISQGEWSAVSAPLAALSTDTGTAVDGTAASGISKAAGDAFLVACADATKELSAKINAIHAVTAQAAAAVVAAA